LNLLNETKEDMAKAGYTPEQIVFIGSQRSGHCCTWAEFELLANFEYDAGYGGSEIPEDLIIVFSDGSWMERGEYDGSEWWEFRHPFVMPAETEPINRIKGGPSWAVTLAERQ
jgi:hypothetical protein